MEFWIGFAVGCPIGVMIGVLGIAALTDWMDGPDEDKALRALDGNTNRRQKR